MGIKDQLTVEQWKVLLNAPGAASAYVSSASGGAMDMAQEMAATSKFLQTSAGGYGALVDELLTAMQTMTIDEKKANAYTYLAKDMAGMRAEAKQLVADAMAGIASLPEAEGWKRWLVELTRQVALTKTGGILGIGAKSVIDEQEQAALDELAALLGVK